MGNNGEVDEILDDGDVSRLTRRNALKAGVAAGVGVAVWGGPQIGIIGSTPAYAALCTVPITTYAGIKGNIDAQDRYKASTPLSCAGGIPDFPGTRQLTEESTTTPGDCGTVIVNPGEEGFPDGGAGVCINSLSTVDGQYCRTVVQVRDNEGGPCDIIPPIDDLDAGTSPNPAFGAVTLMSGPTWLPLPDPDAPSAKKYRVFIECGVAASCFT